TGPGFKPAATAKEGTGRAPHPSAAPHGAEVQAGGDSEGRGSPSLARALARRRDRSQNRPGPPCRQEGAVSYMSDLQYRPGGARRGGAAVARPGRGGRGAREGPCPICRIFSTGRAGVVRPAHPGGGPNDVYRRVVAPGARPAPRWLPRVVERGPSEGMKATSP